MKCDNERPDPGFLKLWSFVQRRLGLIVVVLIWIYFYIYSEFQTESYQKGNWFYGIRLVDLLVFVTCLILIFVNLVKYRFSWRNNSFILLLLVLVRVCFAQPIAQADLATKAFVFSQFPSMCKPTQSEYLNGVGFKYCYDFESYPEASFIVVSREIELTSVDLRKNSSDWRAPLLDELKKEKTNFNLTQCGVRDVYKSFNSTYFIFALC